MAIIMMSSVLVGMLATSDAEAWSSDFSTDDGWTIIGTGFAVTGGQLVGTGLPRNSNEIAKRVWTPTSDHWNTTVDLKFTVFPLSGMFRVGVYDWNLTDTLVSNFNPDSTSTVNFTGYVFGATVDNQPKAYGKIRQQGDLYDASAYTLTMDTWYTLNLRKSNNSGQETIDIRIWDTSGGSWGSPVMQNSTDVLESDAQYTAFAASNVNTGTSGYAVTAYLDNYMEDFDGYHYAVHDLFDDNNAEIWTIGGTGSVSSDQAKSGDYSLYLASAGYARHQTAPIDHNLTYELYWRPTTTSISYICALLNATGEVVKSLLIKGDGGLVRYYDGAVYQSTGSSYSINTWYDLKFVVHDDLKTFDFYFGGAYVNTFVGVDNEGSIDCVQVGAVSGSNPSYFDNVMVYWDAEAEEEGGESELGSFTTSPLLTAINGTAYYYDSEVSGTTGYNVSTNTSFAMNVDASGNVTCTPNLAGQYWVNITADNGTAEVSQNYTLRVYDDDIFFIAHANDIPISTIYWEAGIRYGYDFYVPYLIDGYGEGEVAVAKYDGANDTWSYSGSICNNPTDDGHAGTILIRTTDGKLHIFYGSHESYVYHRESTYANNISSWGSPVAVTGNDATYPQPWVDPDNGTVYMFYRKTLASGSNYQWVYRTSVDDCDSWSGESIFHTYTSGYATYLWLTELIVVNGHYHIPITWSIFNYSTNARENVYYADMNITSGHFHNVTGADLGVTIDLTETENNCKLVDTGSNWSYSAQVVSNGSYVWIMYPEQDGSLYDYHFIYHDGVEWSTPVEMASTDAYYTHCQMFLYDDTIHYYCLLNRTTGSRSEVQYWTYNITSKEWIKYGTILDSSLLSGNAKYIGETGSIWNTTSRSIVITEGTNTGEPVRCYVFGIYGFLINGTHLYDYEPPEEPENDPPIVSSPNPTNGRTGVDITLASWSCSISDPDADLFNWSIEVSNGDNDSANGASDGTKSVTLSDLEYHTQYTVWVNITDGEDASNYTLTFTTEYDPLTVESLPMHDMTWMLFVLCIILVIVALVYHNMEDWGLR